MNLEQRIQDLTKAVEQSIVQHHMLLGRLEEAKYLAEQNKPEQPKEENQ